MPSSIKGDNNATGPASWAQMTGILGPDEESGQARRRQRQFLVFMLTRQDRAAARAAG